MRGRFALQACLLLHLCGAALHASATSSSTLGKFETSQGQMSTASSHLTSQPAPLSSASAHDLTPVTFDDITHGRFLPVPVTQTHLQQIIEGDKDPYTLLLSDPPKEGWAPIIDLTRPRPFRSLNALMHRYKHLHIYRHPPGASDGTLESLIMLMRRPPMQDSVVVTPGSRVHGLNERIGEIEHLRRRYGDQVAWARFHKLFTPLPAAGLRGDRGRAVTTRTWADIVSSPFVPALAADVEAVRRYLDVHRIGKFLSLDGEHVLGIRVDRNGIADHYELAANEVVSHLRA